MILHLQMGIVSYFTDFLSIPHVTKDYFVLLFHPPHVLFCSVLEQQMPFFFFFKSMIKPYKFYRGVSQNMASVFVWTLMLSWLFNISWLQHFWGEKGLFSQQQSSGSSCSASPPQKSLSLCSAVGSSARGIAFAFSESFAWKPRPNQTRRLGSAAGSGGKIHDAYYQPALKTDVSHSQLWSYE